MSIWNSILFALVQGISEFVPVSSSAHLSVMFNLFGVSSKFNVKLFSCFGHMGSMIAVIIMYWSELAEIFFQVLEFSSVSQGERSSRFMSVRLLFMMIFSCLPLFLILPINSYINILYENNIFIGIMLILSGTVLYIAGHMAPGEKTERNMSVTDALIIGLCQAVTAIPGLSRVGTVMTGGIAAGLRKEFAAKYAVLLSVPVLFVSNIFRLVDAVKAGFYWADVPMCLVGMCVSIVSSLFALKVLRNAAEKGRFSGFAYYSWVAGVLFIILTMIF